MLRAVLDTNVFISALIRPDGLPGQLLTRFIENDAFELVITPSIADEIRKAMNYPGVVKHIRGGISPEDWLDDMLLFADMIDDVNLPHPVSDDPDDDKFLAAAVSGHALFIVTGDEHLLKLKEYEGVKIVKPAEFLGTI